MNCKCRLNIAIGNFMKNARRSKGMTEGQLAEILNVSQQHISRYENGKYNFTLKTILLLLKALDKKFNEFVEVVYWGEFEDVMEYDNKFPIIVATSEKDDLFNFKPRRGKKYKSY